MFMKNLSRLIILALAVVLIAVSCIPYGLEYRDVTFYNYTAEPVDISYRLLGDRYSVATRVYGIEKISVCTIYGKADISVEGPYASYLFTDYMVYADGTTNCSVSPNRGLIEVYNTIGDDIYDVCLGTTGNPRRCRATFDLVNKIDTVKADIVAGKSAGIRVPYSALTTTEIGTYYIFFKSGYNTYRTKAAVSIPKHGEKIKVYLTLSNSQFTDNY